MSGLPQVRPDRLIPQIGAHCFLHHADGRTLNIPLHQGRDVPLGTLRSILADAKMSADAGANREGVTRRFG
ncbi:MAG: type II toxin-antitoxin system HicA family toxin [Candidatus Cybelea sp.]